MKKKFIIMACAAVLLVGCGNPKLQDGKEVIASMKDKNITVEDLYNSLKDQYGTEFLINLVDEYIADTEHPTTDEIKKEIDDEYNSQKTQNEEYYGVSFDVILQNYGYTEESYRKALMTSYKQKLIVLDYIKSKIAEEDIEKYYKENMYGKITARHILISPKKTNNMTTEQQTKAKKDAYDLAVSLIKRLDNGEKFDELAKEFSDDTVSAENGGLLEPFDNNSGFVKEFFEASAALEVGKYSATPVESQYGYHIILKEAEEERKPYEEVKDEILDKMANDELSGSNSQTLISKALYEARKKYNLEIADNDIKEAYEKNTKSLKD